MRVTAKQNNKKLLIKLICMIIGMFVFCYLMVPLYRLVCKQAGINGKGEETAAVYDPHMKVDTSRTIDVDFTTTVHGNLKFLFKPLRRHMKVHPGERALVYFFAENDDGRKRIVQAVPSIMPGEAAKYFKKTQCFCFTQQPFFKGEKVDMPVYFFIEPDLPKDIHYMTLSYTLFDATHFKKNGLPQPIGRIQL